MSRGLDPPFGARDPADMAGLIAGAPEQIEQAVARWSAAPLPLPTRDPDLVAAGGMGGSAIAADLTATLEGDRLPRPLLVVRDYRWPACVTSSSLAVICSYSGTTEETLALYHEAGTRGVPRIAITTGGPLGAQCDRDRVPWARLPAGMPPRAALHASWVVWTGLLHALGWIADPLRAWRQSAAALRRLNQAWGPDVPEPGNRAKRIARDLDGRFLFIYGGARLAPVLKRWRNQFNENAKLLGHSAVVPEFNHNEVVGWERPGPVADRAVLILRDREDPPEVAARLDLTAKSLERSGVPVHDLVSDVEEREGGRLARMASMVHLGDYLSLYLALLGGVDPTPIASIEAFKRELEEYRRGR